MSERGDRFSCSCSPLLLPTYRRPNYKSAIYDKDGKNKSTTQTQTDTELLRKWTSEKNPIYREINKALLSDDIDGISKNQAYILALKSAIRNEFSKQSFRCVVYRGLNIGSNWKQQYKAGTTFLWPTFTSTSRSMNVAQGFGNVVFRINIETGKGLTYFADVSKYSEYPFEQEILFYPYSGFEVTNVNFDLQIVDLKCYDTIEVERLKKLTFCEVTIEDQSRKILVFLSTSSSDILWANSATPNQKSIIAGNGKGYWDSTHRYHHKNGYFLNTGNGKWEEWQNDKLFASFVEKSST